MEWRSGECLTKLGRRWGAEVEVAYRYLQGRPPQITGRPDTDDPGWPDEIELTGVYLDGESLGHFLDKPTLQRLESAALSDARAKAAAKK